MAEWQTCYHCTGSGQGQYEGTLCQVCKGSGVEPVDEDETDNEDNECSDALPVVPAGLLSIPFDSIISAPGTVSSVIAQDTISRIDRAPPAAIPPHFFPTIKPVVPGPKTMSAKRSYWK